MPSRQGLDAFTVSAELVRGIVDCAVRCGVDRARLSDLIPPESAERTAERYAGTS